MTAQLTKTAAIREAAKHVSIHGRGTSWSVICPHGKPNGPTTELRACSYFEARAKAARCKASVALKLMDVLTERAVKAIYNADSTNTRRLVDIALRAA